MKTYDWARPKQKFLVNRADPLAPPGDCWRCCVAAILQVPAEDVPHFVAGNGGCSYEADTQAWLAARGFTLIQIRGSRLQFPRFHDEEARFQPVPVMTCGPTPRSEKMGQLHAVVYYDEQMVYDPHPSGVGLTAITHEYLIVRV